MDLLLTASLLVIGFVACAEFGSYAFVHPVLWKLPTEHRVVVEKGLLRTFGRVMPVGMTACPVLAVSLALRADAGAQATVGWLAFAALAVALVTTIAVNVGINAATGRWDPEDPPEDWEAVRRRWERFQAIRSWLLLVGFALVCVHAGL